MEHHPTVCDAAWSVAVQHGGAGTILAAAVRLADAALARADGGYDRRLVQTIYDECSAYISCVAARSDSAAPCMLESVVRNRYPAELAAALAMFENMQFSA